MRVLALVAGLAAAGCGVARADALAFNAAGDALWSPGPKPGTLSRTEVATGESATIEVKDEDGTMPEYIALARGEGTSFWLLSKSVLWSWREGAATAEVAGGSADLTFAEMAAGDGGKRLLMTTTDGYLWNWSADDRKFREVQMRHLNGGVRCPCFLGDGTFLFAIQGDLWHGWVEREVDESFDDPVRLLLWAYRMAPLAERNTYPGTPSQIGVEEIAVAHDKVYVSVGRMGGSGWGHVARLKPPPPFRGEWTERNSTKDSIAALKSVEEIMDNSGWSALCATRDGGKLHFLGDNHAAYLLGPDGTPVRMKSPDPQ